MSDDLASVLFKNTSDGVVIYEPLIDGSDFLIVDFNPAAENIEGVNRSEIVGKRLTEVFPGVVEFGLFDVLTRVNQTGISQSYPLSIYSDHNTFGWRENFICKVPNSNQIAVLYKDTKKFIELFNSAHGFVSVISSDGVLIESNDAALKIANLSRRDVIGQKLWDTFWWSYSKAIRKRIRDVLTRVANGEVVREEFELRICEDNTINIDASFSPITDANGKIEKIFGFAVDISAQKQAEVKALSTQKLLWDVIEIIPDGIVFFDDQNRFVFCNKQYRKMFPKMAPYFSPGVQFERLVDLWIEKYEGSLTSSEKKDWKRRRLESFLKPKKQEIQNIGDGQYVIIEDFKISPGATVGVRRDISALKLAVQEKIENEELLRAFIHYSPLTMALKNLEGRYQIVNKGFEALSGVTPAEAIGKTVAEVFPDNYAEKILHRERKVYEIGAPSSSIQEMHGVDGKKRIFKSVKFPVANVEGNYIGLGTVAEDVTEIRSALSELKALNDQLMEVQKVAQLGSWEVNYATGELTWSEEVYRIFEISPEAPIATSLEFYKFVHPEDRARVRKIHARFRNSPETYEILHRIQMKDGRIKWVQERCHREFDVDGALQKLGGTVQDVSRQILAERALQETKQVETIGQLAVGVAHDFNNLLTPVLGFAHLGLETPNLPVALREGFIETVEVTRRAKILLDQLFFIGRRKDERRKPVNLQALIDTNLTLLKRLAQNTVRISTCIDSSCPSIDAEEFQINQILLNLFTNALHSISDNGTIEVSLKQVSHDIGTEIPKTLNLKSGRYASVSVRDDGFGIPEDIQNRIFEPFYTTKGTQYGTGLGLFIVSNIVEHYGGEIIVQSEPGEGALFEVFLPLFESVD